MKFGILYEASPNAHCPKPDMQHKSKIITPENMNEHLTLPTCYEQYKNQTQPPKCRSISHAAKKDRHYLPEISSTAIFHSQKRDIINKEIHLLRHIIGFYNTGMIQPK